MGTPRRTWSGWRWGLLAVLAVSCALRLVLVLRGGQFFWADESRYGVAVDALTDWEHGQHGHAIRRLIGTADHLGFKVLMLGPAWLQLHAHGGLLAPSIVVSLFSVANILWIWLIARQAGGTEREGFWAAAAMASANSMFYWARHIMPYDVSLFWALAAAFVGWHPRPGTGRSLLAGMLGFAAFATYNGYWATVACILTAHVLLAWPDRRALLRRAGFGFLGLAGSFLLLLWIPSFLGINLLGSYVGFAGTINQGDFNQGALVFFDYLWRTEGLTALVWLGCLLFGLIALRRAPAADRRRLLAWAGTVLALALIMIVGANVLEKFVVYGRLVRQVAPFCALLVGWTAARAFGSGRGGRALEAVALALLFASAARQMATPLRQEFPLDFHLRGTRTITAYRREHAAEGAAVGLDRFQFVYTNFIWAYPKDVQGPLPAHYQVLRRTPHPLAWRPYLYEGFNADQRAAIESTDISMRLILLQD